MLHCLLLSVTVRFPRLNKGTLRCSLANRKKGTETWLDQYAGCCAWTRRSQLGPSRVFVSVLVVDAVDSFIFFIAFPPCLFFLPPSLSLSLSFSFFLSIHLCFTIHITHHFSLVTPT